MTSWVLENKSTSSSLLLETDRLQRALEVSQTRSNLLGTFLAQYQLSPVEAQALQAEEITAEFFEALDHVRTIHSNCKNLLRTHHQRAGLELLDAMSSLQETAFERLCRWVQSECRHVSDIESPEVEPLLQRAITALKARHVLFTYCAEEIATARQSALFQRFIRALTRGPRPIEMNAPDPWRYVGDMLAWVHTSLASEREFLASLLGEEEGEEVGRGGGREHEGGVETDHSQQQQQLVTLSQLLSTVFEGICRPLRVRIEQVLMSSPPPLLSFRLSQLLVFYLRTVDAMLGVASPLSDTLRACHTMAMRTFFELVKHRGDRLARHPPPPPPDLACPAQIEEGAVLVADLVEHYETSLVTSSTGGSSSIAPGTTTGATTETTTKERRKGSEEEEIDPTDVDAVLAAVLDPLVAAIQRSSEALNPNASNRLDDGSHMDPSDQHIFMVNCLCELQRPLLGHPCAVPRLHMLRETMDAEISKLVNGAVSQILTACGLAEVLERLRLYERSHAVASASDSSTPAADPALSLSRVVEAMRMFFGRLSDPEALPEFRKLREPVARGEAVQQALAALAAAYAQVYGALMDPQNGYSAGEVGHAVKHTPNQVKTLLGVQ